MKKKFVLPAVFSIALVFGFVLSGCEDPDVKEGEPALVAAPEAIPASGAVAPGTWVTLSTATAGAAIYYTTDGTMPTTSSTPYSSPIPVTTDLTIKAIAAKEGMTNSGVFSAAYTVTIAIDAGNISNMKNLIAASGGGTTKENPIVVIVTGTALLEEVTTTVSILCISFLKRCHTTGMLPLI